ncbi:MAG: hypothetical protein EPN73_07115 [Paraburkholderia sp.]|nr:MAG: hypothetical protein EPN73_07115 [Paraburkholderia sp.]
MIRTKNELDYRLFRSSTRVYFGKGLDIFGRNLIDNELPATELLLAKPENVDAITRGAVKLTAQLKDEGTTAIWVVPMMKEYFNPNRLPFFAPRLAIPSNFQTLYGSLKKQPDLHFVDVFQIIESLKGKYPIFHQQDFHWTDMSAMAVASDTVNTIARLSESKTRWEHPMEVIYEPQIGSDARFSARLNEEGIPAPVLKKTWQDRHTFASLDPKTTGLEFETNAIDDPDLLPPTCMYGNSFGDGMLRAGMTDYFKKFTKFDRALPLSAIPDLARGRCKYMVIQILDLSSGLWASLRK